MRRVIGWSIPLVLIAIGLLWPLVFKVGHEALPADDPVVFSNFKADFRVNADGSLSAVETITAEFPSGRHGLFQYWDTSNQNHPYVRQVPDIESVKIDGVPIGSDVTPPECAPLAVLAPQIAGVQGTEVSVARLIVTISRPVSRVESVSVRNRISPPMPNTTTPITMPNSRTVTPINAPTKA